MFSASTMSARYSEITRPRCHSAARIGARSDSPGLLQRSPRRLPAVTLRPLHRVMNAATRVMLDLRPHDHVSTALRQLHWLPVEYHITYKLCLLVHLAINGHAPCTSLTC
jgi:hypothetical protein